MAGAGAALGLGLTLLDRLVQAWQAGKAEDAYRNNIEQNDLAMGQPSISSYQFTEGQDPSQMADYRAPHPSAALPQQSSFLERLLAPEAVVRRAEFRNAQSEADAKTFQAALAKELADRREFQRQLTLRQSPQWESPSLLAQREATTKLSNARAIAEPDFAARARAQAGWAQQFMGAMGQAPQVQPQSAPSQGVPAGFTPYATIGDNGAVTPAPGVNIDPKDLPALQGALARQVQAQGGNYNYEWKPSGASLSGPTFKREMTDESKLRFEADKGAAKTTASEAAKNKAERQQVSSQADLAIQTIDDLSRGINTSQGGVEAYAKGSGRELMSHIGMDPEIKQYAAARNTLTPTIARAVENLKGRLPVMDQRWVNESAFPVPTDTSDVRNFKVGLLRFMKRAADGEDVAGEMHDYITKNAPGNGSSSGGGQTWVWKNGKLTPQ